MKQSTRLTLIIFVLSFIVYIVFRICFAHVVETPVAPAELLLVGAPLSILYAVGARYLIGLTLNPLLCFLESKDTVVPDFTNKIAITYEVEDDEFSLEAMRLKLEKMKYVTTFFDKERKILKFHSRLHLSCVTCVGGSIVYDKKNRSIDVVCFPFYRYVGRAIKRTAKTTDHIEHILHPD
ncbi:MAG: hypothetical protein LBH80_04745 [Prevotellaceae bacterium]|jgi:hypothetical protein|nr:hypothetical protein [Prevotellaceae bacterium]